MTAYADTISRPVKTLTEAEQRALLKVTGQHVDGFRDHVIFSLAMGTGLREHELLALDVGDVFDDAGRAKRRVALRVFKRSAKEPVPQEVLLPDAVRELRRRHPQHLGVELPSLEVVATQERHLPIDEVEERGVGLLGVRAHQAPEALDGATARAARVREEHAREARQVESLVGEARRDDDRQLAGAGAIEQLLADGALDLPGEHRRRCALGFDGGGERVAVVDAPGEHEADVAGAGFGDHVLDDERVARRVARDGGEHRRVVLGAGVEVREVRLHAVNVGHREDARRDQLVVRDGEEDKEQKVPNFVLAGRPWRIVGVDWKGGTCSVEPAEVGGYPRWFGLPVSLERSLCQAMRRVLASKDTDPSWSKRAVTQLELQRESHAFLEDSSLPLEEDPDGRCRWWTFGGGAGNRVLAGLLELELGERVSPSNTFITFSNGAAESAVGIRQAIDALAARTLTWDDAARLVDPGQRSRVSKFQPCLPPEIEHGLIARETMNVGDANATLVEWKQGATRQESGRQ